MPDTILLVEDDDTIRFFLSRDLADEGYEVLEAGLAKQALTLLSSHQVDLVILDLKLPDRSGLDLLPDILDRDPDLPVIFLSGEASVGDAVRAMKLRACDFIEKPPDLPILKRTIAHLLRNVQLQREVQRLRASPKDSTNPFVAGRTRKMARVIEIAERMAATNTSVLITGESGTGKERIAELIHSKSKRSVRPMLAINCAAIPEHLLESELFGSVKGAYTGAVDRPGLVEKADRSTLFLDEISAMKPDMQVKLMRILEDRVVRRLGSHEDIPVDVRIISASNRDLLAAIKQDAFREDLYYRLAVVVINLPPLRERRQDIPLIAAAYIDHFNRETGRFVEGLTPEALACLEAYSWPGNIRELRNIIERAVILCDSPQIGTQHLPPEIARLSLEVTELDQDSTTGLSMPFGRSLLEIERRLISDAVERAHGDLNAAARMLGISLAELKSRLSTP